MDAQAHKYSACRSRAITCVAGTATRPSALATWASTAGSMFEYVPTAPESLQTAIAWRAAIMRRRSRSSCSAHNETLAPNVVGSACMPWVRPTITVVRCSRANVQAVVISWSSSSMIRFDASRSIQHHAVSTISVLVNPWCSHAPDGIPIRCCTTSTNAATSWLVTISRSDIAATKTASTVGAMARQAAASALGTTPRSAWASVANNSISRYLPKRDSSVKIAFIAGNEYRPIMPAPRSRRAPARRR